ncbi:MAG: hypothetical protein NT165_00565 [Candidatus Falkowbacteria bacterium]|nr:hypothetical protein [Candidatus Falkowbacteria bacterium]
MKNKKLMKVWFFAEFFISRLGKSFWFCLLGSIIFTLAFILISLLVLHQPFEVSTDQEYFWQVAKTWRLGNINWRVSGYWNFAFAILWSMLVFLLDKMKFLEKHELVNLTALNFFSFSVGIYSSFYFHSLLFGLIAHFSFLLIYFGIIIFLEINEIIWGIMFPD